MARKVRFEYRGAVYHVMDPGDHREAIFRDDADRQRFIDTLGEACAKTGWRVHAYVLIDEGVAAAWLAAGGPVTGRAWDSEGQCGRAARV